MIKGSFCKCNLKRSSSTKKIKYHVRLYELVSYMSLPYDFQSKIGYNSLIQNVTLKDLINIMATTMIDLDIELKYLENRKLL